MKKQNLVIAALCFSAAVLLAAALLPADFAIKDQNYQLITVTGQKGSSTVFVIDNRQGKLAVFTPDVRTPSRYNVGKVQDMSDYFQTGR
jgi:6-phosphogluconolactonase (cycloisomerase 2 family)